MAPQPLLLDDTAIQTLLKTASAPTDLAQTPTAQWPERLQQRLDWLTLWDATLAPLLQTADRPNEAFALKAQTVNELLDVWALGQNPQTHPNSAALLLQAHQSGADLVPAIAAWGQWAVSAQDKALRHRLGDEAQAIKDWLQRWGRKDAELAMLQHISALGYLEPKDQERLTSLGGSAYKEKLMQVDPQLPRISLRERVDSHSLDRYFKDDAMSSETMLALRTKHANPTSERLPIGRWHAETFFNALRQASSHSQLLGEQFDLEICRVTVVNGNILTPTDACVYTHRSADLKLLMTVTVQASVAIIKLALLVPCDAMLVSDYCAELLRIADSTESDTETMARGEIVEKVLQEALAALKAHNQSGSSGDNSQMAG